MQDNQGRASQHEIILGKHRQDQGPRKSIGEEGNEGQDTRGEYVDERAAWTTSAGQSRKEKTQRMKDQPEERAKQPPRTGASRAERRTAPDWSIRGSGPSALDGNIRGRAKKHDAAPLTGTSRGTRAAAPDWNIRERRRAAPDCIFRGRTRTRSGEQQRTTNQQRTQEPDLRNGGSSGESQPTQDLPGQPGQTSRTKQHQQ